MHSIHQSKVHRVKPSSNKAKPTQRAHTSTKRHKKHTPTLFNTPSRSASSSLTKSASSGVLPQDGTYNVEMSADYDMLASRNPYKSHSDSFEDLPMSIFPEDARFSFRQYLRDKTDTIITVRRSYNERYCYSEQIIAMHSTEPKSAGKSMSAQVRPARLVLEGANGIKALSLLDQAQTMPLHLDKTVDGVKQQIKSHKVDQNDPHSQQLLDNVLQTALPTTLHTSDLLMVTPPRHTTSNDIDLSEQTESASTDIAVTKELYAPQLAYAQASAQAHGVGLWDVNSGTADSIAGQHLVFPGQLIATTSDTILGSVAAMGGISMRVSSLEAAGLMLGESVPFLQGASPLQIDLHGMVRQWTSIQDVTALVLQFIGERGFHHPYGQKLPVSIEITDKLCLFSIDELSSLCRVVGSLPHVQTITVLPNATQLNHLRVTNRGAYTSLLREYAPQLLEPDFRAVPADLMAIDLTKIEPMVTVSNSACISSLNPVSCELDYVAMATGTAITSQRLNMNRFTHIDNIARHFGVWIQSFRTGKGVRNATGQFIKTVQNRYKYIDPTGTQQLDNLQASFKNAAAKFDLRNALSRKLGGKDVQSSSHTQVLSAEEVAALAPTTTELEVKSLDPREQPSKGLLSDTLDTLAAETSNDAKSTPAAAEPSSTPVTKQNNQVSKNAALTQTMQDHSELLAQINSQVTEKKLAMSKASQQVAKTSNVGTQYNNQLLAKQRQDAITASTAQAAHHHDDSAVQFWPATPHIIHIHGGYNELIMSCKIALQCIAEGMHTTVPTFIQANSANDLHLLRENTALAFTDPITAETADVITTLERAGVTFVSPGSSNLDYTFLHTLHHKHNFPTNYDLVRQSPCILTTDMSITQRHSGIPHITPFIMTSGHEFTMLTSFTGSLAYDPIRSTLSPQNRCYDPSDPNSLFIVPSRGVLPEVDPETNQLRVPIQYNTTKDAHYDPNQSTTTPAPSLPSNIMHSELTLKHRFDLPLQLHNAVYHESNPITKFYSLDDVQAAIHKDQTAASEQSQSSDQFFTFSPVNTKLASPSQTGYVAQSSTSPKTIQQINALAQQAAQISSDSSTLSATWWNKQNQGDMPVLIHANTIVSAADIAGLDLAIRPATAQKSFIVDHLPSLLQSTLQKYNQSAHHFDPQILASFIGRRLNSASPRHQEYLFPFAQDQLILRSSLGGVQSTHPGSAPIRHEFTSFSGHFSSTANEPTLSLGTQAGWLLDKRAVSTSGSLLSSLGQFIDAPQINNESVSGTSNTPLSKSTVANHFASRSHLLWFAQSDDNGTATDQPVLSSTITDAMMPSVQTMSQTTIASLPRNWAKGKHHGLEQLAKATQASLPLVAMHYALQGRQWAFVADMSRLDVASQQFLSNLDQYSKNDRDIERRWDQTGIGFGSSKDCEKAAIALRLLGCGAVLAPSFHPNFLHSLQLNGILAVNIDARQPLHAIKAGDSLSIMTSYKMAETAGLQELDQDEIVKQSVESSQPDDQPVSEQSSEESQSNSSVDVPLFLPYTSPAIVHHQRSSTSSALHSEIVPTSTAYNPNRLAWFRAGNIVNAGAELTLRKEIIDPISIKHYQQQRDV